MYMYMFGARSNAGLSVHVSETKTSSSGETAQVLGALNQNIRMYEVEKCKSKKQKQKQSKQYL